MLHNLALLLAMEQWPWHGQFESPFLDLFRIPIVPSGQLVVNFTDGFITVPLQGASAALLALQSISPSISLLDLHPLSSSLPSFGPQLLLALTSSAHHRVRSQLTALALGNHTSWLIEQPPALNYCKNIQELAKMTLAGSTASAMVYHNLSASCQLPHQLTMVSAAALDEVLDVFIISRSLNVIVRDDAPHYSKLMRAMGMKCTEEGRWRRCAHPPEATVIAAAPAPVIVDSNFLTISSAVSLAFGEYPQEVRKDCSDYVWCHGSRLLQRIIRDLQRPKLCSEAKFLVVEPQNYGIGAMIHIAGGALLLAACTGRVLYFPHHHHPHAAAQVWQADGCRGASMGCYFQPVTHCELNESAMETWPELNDSNWQSLQQERIVRAGLGDILPTGPCTLCQAPRLFPFPAKLHAKDAFIGSELPLMAQAVRYLLRPLPWFMEEITRFLQSHFAAASLQRPFASLHVRYGDKQAEAPRKSLQAYMQMLQARRPDIRHVFLSTETSQVITTLRRDYPTYTFHALAYDRIESTDPTALRAAGQPHRAQNEFVAAFANLVVSVQADAFVGSLTSNWCRLINELQRTRGDGGRDYWTVDGSQFARCFMFQPT